MVSRGVLQIGLLAAGFALMIIGGNGFFEATGALQGTTDPDPFMDRLFWACVYALVFASAGFPLKAAFSME